MGSEHRKDGCFSWIVLILAVALATGGLSFTHYALNKNCQATCQDQYGEKYAGRSGIYEACDCVGPKGNLKAPR